MLQASLYQIIQDRARAILASRERATATVRLGHLGLWHIREGWNGICSGNAKIIIQLQHRIRC